MMSRALFAAAADRLVGWISPESQEAAAPFFAALNAGIQSSLPPTRMAQADEVIE